MSQPPPLQPPPPPAPPPDQEEAQLALEPSPATQHELQAPEAAMAAPSTAVAEVPRDPAADYAEGLAPGAGTPLVAGPPASVGGPIPAQTVNAFFGIAAVVLLVATVVVVILLAVFVISLLKAR